MQVTVVVGGQAPPKKMRISGGVTSSAVKTKTSRVMGTVIRSLTWFASVISCARAASRSLLRAAAQVRGDLGAFLPGEPHDVRDVVQRGESELVSETVQRRPGRLAGPAGACQGLLDAGEQPAVSDFGRAFHRLAGTGSAAPLERDQVHVGGDRSQEDGACSGGRRRRWSGSAGRTTRSRVRCWPVRGSRTEARIRRGSRRRRARGVRARPRAALVTFSP